MHNCKFYFSCSDVDRWRYDARSFLRQIMLTNPETKVLLWVFFSFSYYAYGMLKLFIQIRIDATGNREYTQFEASPHPAMRPMAYVQGGLSSLLM